MKNTMKTNEITTCSKSPEKLQRGSREVPRGSQRVPEGPLRGPELIRRRPKKRLEMLMRFWTSEGPPKGELKWYDLDNLGHGTLQGRLWKC